MKKRLLIPFVAVLLSTATIAFSQHNNSELPTSIRADGAAPDSSAVFEVQSTDRGVLVPRMDSSQRVSIDNPATGLLVYQTNGMDGFYYYNGSVWLALSNTSDIVDAISDADGDTRVRVEENTDEDQIRFSTGGVERVIIDTTGKVGIGTSSPGYRFTLDGTGNEVYAVWSENGTQSADNFTFQIAPGGGSSSSRIGYLMGNFGHSTGFMIANTRNAPIRFGVGPGPAEKMRISANGNVGIGTTSDAHPLQLGSGAHCTAAGEWTDASDRAKKYDIEDIRYGLQDILNMDPRAFRYKIDDSRGIGFIAQEMETIIPEIVSGEEGEKGIAYGILTSVLVKGMQEQQEIIEAQKKEIGRLKKGNVSLEGRVEAVEYQMQEMKSMLEELIVGDN